MRERRIYGSLHRVVSRVAIAAVILVVIAGGRAEADEVKARLVPAKPSVAGDDLLIRAEVFGMDRVETAEARVVTAAGGLINLSMHPSPDIPELYIAVWRECVDVGEHAISVRFRGEAEGEITTAQARGSVSVIRGNRIEVINPDVLDFGIVYAGENVEAALDVRVAPGASGEVEILTLPLDSAKSRIDAGCYSLEMSRFPAERPPGSPVRLELAIPQDQASGGYEGYIRISSITDELILPVRIAVRQAIVSVEPEALDLGRIELGGPAPSATLRVSVEPRGSQTIVVSQPVIGEGPQRAVISRRVIAGEPAEFTFTVPVSRRLEPGSYRTFVDVAWPGGRITTPVSFEIVRPPMSPNLRLRLGLSILLAALLLALLLLGLFSKRRKPNPVIAFLLASAVVHIVILLLMNMVPMGGVETGLPDKSAIGVVLLPGEPGFMPASGEGGGRIEIDEAGPRSEFERALAERSDADPMPSEAAVDTPDAGAMELAHARAEDRPDARKEESVQRPERIDPTEEVEAAAQLAQRTAEQEAKVQAAGELEIARRDVSAPSIEKRRRADAELSPAPLAGQAPGRAESTERPTVRNQATARPHIQAMPGLVVESPEASVEERYAPTAEETAAPRAELDERRPTRERGESVEPARELPVASSDAPLSRPSASNLTAMRTADAIRPVRSPVAEDSQVQWRPNQPGSIEIEEPETQARRPSPAAPAERTSRGPRDLDMPRPSAVPVEMASRPTPVARAADLQVTRPSSADISRAPGPTGDLPDIHADRGFTMPGMRGDAREGSMTITTAIYSGDWDCDRTAMPNLAFQIRRRTDGALNANFNELRLTDPRIFDSAFVFFTGHNEFRLADEEIAAMRRYIQAGGGIWINDSTHEDDEIFDRALRREISRAFPEYEMRKIEMGHPLLRACYDLSGGYMGYRIPPGDKYRVDYLEGIFIDGRLALLYTRNDYGDGMSIDANTFPLMASLTDLSPQEMMEGSVRMGINAAFYFLFARAGGDEHELGGRLQTAVGRHLEERETRSREIVTAAGRSLEEFAPDSQWGSEAEWSDPTSPRIDGDALYLDIQRGGEGKNVIGRDLSADISHTRYLLLDIENRMSAGARVAIAFSVGEEWRYFESPPRYTRPGRNTLVFDLLGEDYKSEASGWEHGVELAGRNDIRRIYVLVYPIREGEMRLIGVRFVDDLDE